MLLSLQLFIPFNSLLFNNSNILGFLEGIVILVSMIAYALIPLLLLTFGIRKAKVRYALIGALLSFIGIGSLGSFFIQKHIVGVIGFNGWFAVMPLILSLPLLIGFPLGWVIDKKQMTRKAIISTAILLALLAYIGVYFFMTLHGHYEPNYAEPVYGLDTPNEYLLKAAEPKLWWPFRNYVSDTKPSFLRIFYSPLIYLDRTFWHTWEKAGAFHVLGEPPPPAYHEFWRYPIRGYYDEDTKESRYIKAIVSEQSVPAYGAQSAPSAEP